MIETLEDIKKIVREFNLLNNDSDRVRYVKEHQPQMMFRLDSDWTGVEFCNISPELDEILEDDSDNDELYCLQDLDYSFGWSDSIMLLLTWAGIENESC